MAPTSPSGKIDEQKLLEEMFKVTNLPSLRPSESAGASVKLDQVKLDHWAQMYDMQTGRPPTPKPLLDFGVLGECPKCKYTCRDPFDRKHEENPHTGTVNSKITEYLRLTCRQCGYVCRMKCADHDTLAAVVALEKKVEPIKIAEYGTSIPYTNFPPSKADGPRKG